MASLRSISPSLPRRRPTRPVAALLAVVIVAALGGCGEKPEPDPATTSSPPSAMTLKVSVSPATVKPGGTLRASVVNATSEPFTYGGNYELERKQNGRFVKVPTKRRKVLQIARIAKPGSTGPAIKVSLPDGATPGPWKVVIQRDLEGVGDLAGSFQVQR